MVSASFRVMAAVLVSVLLCSPRAFAGDIAIDSADYAQLPADAQQKLVAQMKGKGLLAEGDTVKNAATPAAKESLGPAALLPFVPIVCKAIAGAKKQDELGKCASKKETEEKCKADVETKYSTIEAVCNVIKIF